MSFSKAAKSRLSALVVIRALLGASFRERSAIATSSRPTAPLIPSTTCSTRPRSPSHRAAISSRIPRFSKRPAWSNWSAREAMASSFSTSFFSRLKSSMLVFCVAKDMAGPALHPLGRSPRDPPALARSRLRSRPSGHRRKRRTEGLRPSEPPPKGANSPLLKPPFCRPSHVTVFLGRS